MASKTIGVNLAVGGAEAYKSAINEINSENGVLFAQLKQVKEEYKLNGDQAEGLRKQNELLSQALENQNAKVEEARKRLEEVKTAYNGSGKEVDKAARELAVFETQAARTANEIQTNTEKIEELANAEDSAGGQTNALTAVMDDLAGSSTEVGDVVDSLADKFGVKLPDGLKTALNHMQSFDKGTVIAMGAAAAAVAAVVAAEKKLVDMTLEAAQSAKELQAQSSAAGMSTEELQNMQYAAELMGVSADTIVDGQKEIVKAMAEVEAGSEEAADKFSSLGVSVYDASGELRDGGDVFRDVIDALGNVTNDTERAAAASGLLGESYNELNPIIDAGIDTLEKYEAEAESVGYTLSTDQVQALTAVQDSYSRLQLRQEAVKNQLAAEFAPTVESVFTKFGDFVSEAGETLVESGIVDALGSMLDSSMSLAEPLLDLTNVVLPPLATALQGVAQFVALIADSANLVIGLLTFDFSKVKTALGMNMSSGQFSNYQKSLGYSTDGSYGGNYYDEATGTWRGNGVAANASGDSSFDGGLTWVGESGPEIVSLPRGSQIFSAQESRGMGGDTFYILISAKDVKEFNDIVNIAQNARRIERMGSTG